MKLFVCLVLAAKLMSAAAMGGSMRKEAPELSAAAKTMKLYDGPEEWRLVGVL